MIKNHFFFKTGLIILFSSSLFSFYDPVIKGTTWHTSERNNVFSRCLATATNSEEWKKALKGPFAKNNFCNCLSDEFTKLLSYRDYLIMTRIKFREFRIKAGKYQKKAIQNTEDREVQAKFKLIEPEIIHKCQNNEVLNKGVKEAILKYKKKLREKKKIKGN